MNERQTARAAWAAICNSVLVMDDGYGIEHVLAEISAKDRQKRDIVAVQLIMMGAKFGTPELVLDGDWGQQSELSLKQLFAAKEER